MITQQAINQLLEADQATLQFQCSQCGLDSHGTKQQLTRRLLVFWS